MKNFKAACSKDKLEFKFFQAFSGISRQMEKSGCQKVSNESECWYTMCPQYGSVRQDHWVQFIDMLNLATHLLATSLEIAVAITQFSVALVTRKAQFWTVLTIMLSNQLSFLLQAWEVGILLYRIFHTSRLLTTTTCTLINIEELSQPKTYKKTLSFTWFSFFLSSCTFFKLGLTSGVEAADSWLGKTPVDITCFLGLCFLSGLMT